MNFMMMDYSVCAKLILLFVGDGEKICILDSGVTPSNNLQMKYPVNSINLSSDSSSEDVLNHGTASISVPCIYIIMKIGYRKSKSKLSRDCSSCSYCVFESS